MSNPILAARVVLQAHEPLWFRGLDGHGNGWDPRVLHATALNFALPRALGFIVGDRAVDPLWCLHSRPYPKFPAWMTPARQVEGSLIQSSVFRGGRSGEDIQLSSAPPAPGTTQERGASIFRLQIEADGFSLVAGKSSNIGKPYLTDGYTGTWEAMIFVTDPELADLMAEPILLRLGPNRVPVEVTVAPFESLAPLAAGETHEADHLADPWLLPADLPVRPVHCRPYPVVVPQASHGTRSGVRCCPAF